MKTLINQTQAIVQMEISHVLEEYPHHPYQQVFANPDRRQDLLAYVLTNVANIYSSIDLEAAHRFSDDRYASSPTNFPTVVGLTIEGIVHRGINMLINQEDVHHTIPNVMDSGRMASSWFG